jgi:hypothetical protein
VGRLCARRRSYDVRSPHRPVGFAVTQRAACGRRAGVGDAVSDLTDMDVLSDDEWAWGANGVDPTRSRVRMSRRGARHWAAALVHSLSTGGSLHASEKRGESRPPPLIALVHSLSTGGSLHASEKRGESRPPSLTALAPRCAPSPLRASFSQLLHRHTQNTRLGDSCRRLAGLLHASKQASCERGGLSSVAR